MAHPYVIKLQTSGPWYKRILLRFFSSDIKNFDPLAAHGLRDLCRYVVTWRKPLSCTRYWYVSLYYRLIKPKVV